MLRYLFRYHRRVSSALLLRQARRNAGLSQRELAALAGTSQPAIARYESGRGEPRADTLERLLAACGAALATVPTPTRAEHVPATGPRGRLLRRRRSQVLEAVTASGLSNPRVFGSVVRGEDSPSSDIDLLVDLGPDGDVLALNELRERLSRLLGPGVDVTTPSIMRPAIRDAALAEAVPL